MIQRWPVSLPSIHFPTGILKQKEDYVLECIFLAHKQSKKLKTYIEKVSEWILKGKLKLQLLVRMDPLEIVVLFTNTEMASLWAT